MRRCLLGLVVLVLVLPGCSRLFGQRYDNFTAYYNTFYNARQEFERAEAAMLRQERPVERDRFLPLFVEPGGTTQGRGFQNAIEKGADLLREHPESKWIDDALLLIGKAYYYEGNLAGAEQKFREVLALDAPHLRDEATLWLGRTLSAAEDYDEASLVLREGLAREGVRDRWAAPMQLALGEIGVHRGEHDEAVEALEAGLELVRDDELAARAAFLLGQIYETLGQHEAAARSYGRALAHRPRYELAYAAELQQALALGLHGQPEEALALLRRMARDDKHFDNFAEIEVARARVLAANEQPETARDLLRTLLYDPDPSLRTGTLSGPLHYRLGEVYRDGLNDYIRAAAHFDTAATVLRAPQVREALFAPQAITDASELSETFGAYARVATRIVEYDSLLYLASLDDEAFAAAIDAIREQRRREAEAQAREMARRRQEQGFGGQGPRDFYEGVPGGQGATGDEGAGGAAAGFLGYRNPVRVQEALVAFQARWGDRPYAPNWRRSAAIGGGVEVQGEIAQSLGENPSVRTPGFTYDEFVDASAVPRDPASVMRMREDRAVAWYELGNVLFLQMNQPDSALVWYQRVVDEEPESPVSARAYYALAEAHRALGNETEAEALYREVLDRFPDREFAGRVRERLGLPVQPEHTTATADSLVQAEAAYAAAYRRWQAGALDEALEAMLEVAEGYAATPVAAQARLAAGLIYTEWAAADPEALFAPTPAALLYPPVPADSAGAVPDTAAVAPADAAAPASLPLYTWVFHSTTNATEAERVAGDYRAFGYEIMVIPEEVEAQVHYRIGIGRFGRRAEAEVAQEALPADVAAEAWLLEADPATEVLAATTAVPEGSTFGQVEGVFAAVDPAAQDSAAVADAPEPAWLETLYASIETDFPDTRYAERARLLRQALEERRPVPEEPEASPVDTLEVRGDTLATSEAVVGFDRRALLGEQPLQSQEGGFTWVVFSASDLQAARNMLLPLADQGFRVAVATTGQSPKQTYHVVVGQFAAEAEAEAARSSLPAEVQPEALRLQPLVEFDSVMTVLEVMQATPRTGDQQ